MARNDYSECFTRPSPWVLCWKHLLPRQGEVLDVACGPGRHTALLALEGHRVLACDIDLTGVEALAELPNVTLECRDLEGEPWPWEAERFAGIVVTNYLHRPHFPYYWDSLMPGGVLIMETFTEANMMIWEHPRNPDHYLTEGGAHSPGSCRCASRRLRGGTHSRRHVRRENRPHEACACGVLRRTA